MTEDLTGRIVTIADRRFRRDPDTGQLSPDLTGNPYREIEEARWALVGMEPPKRRRWLVEALGRVGLELGRIFKGEK
jgi:hypothetical protein